MKKSLFLLPLLFLSCTTEDSYPEQDAATRATKKDSTAIGLTIKADPTWDDTLKVSY